jgi:D-sedoheptulose 7-phosphate isomerase
MIPTIEEELHSHRQVLETMVGQSASLISDVATAIVRCFKKGNKLLLCGNGGSAADAQHVAAEFVNRFRLVRGAMPALALTTDTSIITSVANDSAFEDVFARQVEALAVGGDILVGISTSGGSTNVLRALDAARARGVTTVGFTGEKGRETLATKCDYCLVVPSADTARIQECHGFAWHVICGIVERAMFPQR